MTCGFIQSLPLWMPHRTACRGFLCCGQVSAASRKNAVPVLWDLSMAEHLCTQVLKPPTFANQVVPPLMLLTSMKCLSHHAFVHGKFFQPVGLCTCSLHCLQYSLLALLWPVPSHSFECKCHLLGEACWPSHFSWHALILPLTCSHSLYGCYHNLERSCQYTVFV